MSKKSRKRNKKILAAIGIGLGAAALASRKKGNAADANDGFRKKSESVPTGPKELGISTAKKDTSKSDSSLPDNLSKNMGKDNTKEKIRFGQVKVGNKKKTIKPFKSLDLGGGEKKLKLQDNSIRAQNRETNAAGIKEPNKPMAASFFPRSKSADNYAGDMRDFQKTNYNRNSNIFKSGGRVKGCGKALRGFGKAMKGKR